MDKVWPTLRNKGATLEANYNIGHTIGRCSFIGTESIVTKDVPDHKLMVGNTAKQIGWCCSCWERLNRDHTCNVCKNIYHLELLHSKYSKTI
jgi:UDP-2-acetamido-3-amino-2,3-dideoxy-glucuronate N-acetyltransferase